MKDDQTDAPDLAETLNRLEARISRLETYLGLTSGEPATSGPALPQDRQAGDVSGIEMKIGEFCTPSPSLPQPSRPGNSRPARASLSSSFSSTASGSPSPRSSSR